MNQILLTDNENNNRKKNNTNKNSSNYNRNSSNDIKKIITFFAVVILIFGIAISCIYGYKIYKNNSSSETTIGEPTISLENTEEEVTIIAQSEAGLSKIIYQWNDSEEKEEELNGRTKQEERIGIPTGNNTLKVKVIDQLGQEKETTQEFSREDTIQGNSEKIEINLSVIKDGTEKGKLKISVKSEVPIKYVAYKWNDEEETRVESENEQEQTEMEIKIDVKRGKNTLSVTAEDVEGNTNTQEENYEGKLNPEFEVYREGNRLCMKITHDKGFKKIEFNINGTELVYDDTKSIYDAERQEVEFYFNLKEGENLVKINAFSNEETSSYYEGKCTL